MRDSGLLDVLMIELRLLPPSVAGGAGTDMSEYMPDVCVRGDGSVDDAFTVEFLTVAALTREPEQLKRCVGARTRSSTQAECLHYLGTTSAWKGLVRQLARRAYCDNNDSVEQDEILLRSIQSNDVSDASEQTTTPSSIQN